MLPSPLKKTVHATALVLAVAFSTVATVATATVPAQAAAAMVKTQAPGYYRTMLGDLEITALIDGFFDLPVDSC